MKLVTVRVGLGKVTHRAVQLPSTSTLFVSCGVARHHNTGGRGQAMNVLASDTPVTCSKCNAKEK